MSSSLTDDPLGFAGAWGYLQDADSGLKLLGHRYYDSSTGRFLTRDPAMQGSNWYAYCANRPTSLLDQAGLAWRRVVGCIAGGILGGILSCGNPIGIAIGAGLGSALGDAGDQAAGGSDVNWGEAAEPGAIDGVLTYIGAKVFEYVAAGLGSALNSGEQAVGIQANRIQGQAAEEWVLDQLRGLGYDAAPYRKGIPTLYGYRFPDIGIFQNGQLVSLVEVKSGNAIYSTLQAAKDGWIWRSTALLQG